MEFSKEIIEFRSTKNDCVTILIPKDYPVHLVEHKIQHKFRQYAETRKTEKKKVIEYLKEFLSKLSTYKPSSNGWVVLLGNEFQKMIESKVEIRYYWYLRSNHFDLEFFNDRKNIWLITWIVGGKTKYITYDHFETINLDNVTFPIMSSTRRGGASSSRFARIKEEGQLEFVKKSSEKLRNLVKKINPYRILLIGIDEYKKMLVSCPELSEFKNKILFDNHKEIKENKDIKDYIKTRINKELLNEEKRICNVFLENISKGAYKISFDYKEIIECPNTFEIIVSFKKENIKKVEKAILISNKTEEGTELLKYGTLIGLRYF